jgi:hypothetical protein
VGVILDDQDAFGSVHSGGLWAQARAGVITNH